MNIWRVIKGLAFKELRRLALLFIRHPLKIYPTFRATKETIAICDRLYDKVHHGHGPANAFRHALWNALIARHAYAITGNAEAAASWVKQFTDLHEELSPNNAIEKAMDLHNNRIGRELFLMNPENSTAAIMELIRSQVAEAVLISKQQDIKKYPNQLICIE
ncbi:DUF6973 domain-containing protein [Aquimarina brevivitae]|uniref:DUF6973 domain-containing protein n=1 Tax=Aquimarina brevivitae TaxID=323412 RepID=A0A4Q7PGX1_9FLAO|nr:hypothetical protein [Aquimarina brevivitae]RZS99168.1 hypothetical protein EV197_0377 [Aquimarina brevivitae]